MSTIKTNTLTGTTSAGVINVTGEGGSTTTNLQQGLCKAWFNFKGTDTVSLLDSNNIASMTDNGTGRYTGSLSNNMGNNNYCISCTGDFDGGSDTSGAHGCTEHDNNSTSSFQFQSFRPSDDGYTDVKKAPALIVGDLA
jgi:hypothetical protein